MSEENITSNEAINKNKPVYPTLWLTHRQEKDIVDAFNILDEHGRGWIEPDKLNIAIQALGYEASSLELNEMIESVQTEESGNVSLDNFRILMMRQMAKRDTDEDIIKSFLLIDIDDSGAVSFENLRTISDSLGENLTDQEICEMIDAVELDEDGKITQDAFLTLINKTVTLETP